MSEYIISDEQIMSERSQAYEAGKRQREVWTARVYHGEEIVRCRDCKYLEANKYGYEIAEDDCGCIYWDADFSLGVAPDGFCAWGAKKEVGAHFWRCECGAENYGFETCQYCGRSER